MTQHIRFILGYPKLLAFLLSCLFAYVLFDQGAFDVLATRLNGHGYVSIFLGGLLFSFGFTTPFAVALFAELGDTVNPLLAAPLAGIGALVSDLCILNFVRLSFVDELHRLSATALFQRIRSLVIHPSLFERIRLYLLWSIAGFLIASPFPDELGVTIISGVSTIDSRRFALLCYLLNTTGILIILLTSRAIGT
jgi:hypothetical protein